jgi:hypothetical protein
LAKLGPALIDPQVVKAYEHPIRIDILCRLQEEPSSPTRISRQMPNVSLNLVAHHMKVLQQLGCIELIETVEKRGATEHIYRAIDPRVISDRAWEQLPAEARHPMAANLLRLLSADLARALAAGTFDGGPETHLSRTPMRLDKEGWSEVARVLERALEEVIEIGERTAARIDESDESDEEAIGARVAILQFAVPPHSDED